MHLRVLMRVCVCVCVCVSLHRSTSSQNAYDSRNVLIGVWDPRKRIMVDVKGLDICKVRYHACMIASLP